MASAVNKLSAAFVSKTTEAGLYSDGGGLYLQVSRWKTKAWIFRFMIDGRSRYMGLGSVSTFGLAEARERARAARQLVADGIDPIEERRGKRAAKRAAQASRVTFRQASERYIAAHKAGWGDKHTDQWTGSLRDYVWPLIGDLAVGDIDTGLVLKIVQPLWSEKPVTASRVRNRIEAVLDLATTMRHRSGDNPARWKGHLENALPAKRKVAKVEHLAALPFSEVPALMQRLRGREDTSSRALEFLILTAARSGEVLGARWGEVDLDKGIWVIPADRMKADREHRVALSGRALEILRGLPQGSNAKPFVFRAGSRADRPLSHKSMIRTLRAMGLEQTVHGFRSAFRDWVGERSNFPGELAEAALAHAVGDATERAYRRGDAIEKRRKLMEAWSRYCAEKPAEGGKVVPMQGRA